MKDWGVFADVEPLQHGGIVTVKQHVAVMVESADESEDHQRQNTEPAKQSRGRGHSATGRKPADSPAQDHITQPRQQRVEDVCHRTDASTGNQKGGEDARVSTLVKTDRQPGQRFSEYQEDQTHSDQCLDIQPAQENHAAQAAADGIEDLKDQPVSKADAHPERIEQHNEEPAFENKGIDAAIRYTGRFLAPDAQRQGPAGQENERRGTQVCHPAHQKLSGRNDGARLVKTNRVGHISPGVEHTRGVVEGHQHDDDPPHDIDGRQPLYRNR